MTHTSNTIAQKGQARQWQFQSQPRPLSENQSQKPMVGDTTQW